MYVRVPVVSEPIAPAGRLHDVIFFAPAVVVPEMPSEDGHLVQPDVPFVLVP